MSQPLEFRVGKTRLKGLEEEDATAAVTKSDILTNRLLDPGCRYYQFCECLHGIRCGSLGKGAMSKQI